MASIHRHNNHSVSVATVLREESVLNAGRSFVCNSTRKYIMKYLHFINLTVLTVLLSLFPSNLWGQEWSEPIQLTDTEGQWLSPPLFLFIDNDDVLHVAYEVQAYELEYPNHESFYQRFSRTGEPLMDPVPITIASGIPDSAAYLLAANLDPNGLFHIIFHSDLVSEGDRWYYTFYYSRINAEGEVVLGPIILPDFEMSIWGDITNLAVDSNGRLIIGGESSILQDTTYVRGVYYQRYNEDIELIGETHLLDHDRRAIKDNVRMRMIAGDTLLFVWRQNRNLHNTVHFSKVAPDDEIIIDDEELLPRDDWGDLGYSRVIAVDNNSNLIVPLSHTREDYRYIRKYDSSLNEIFQTRIAEDYDNYKDLFVDNNNHIHHVGSYRPPDRRRSLFYFQLDEGGDFIDSCEIVFEKPREAREWDEPKVFACDDGFTGVMWLQDLEGGGEHYEILLSYKNFNAITENDYFDIKTGTMKFYTVYPNPFNALTTISYRLQSQANVTLKIFDINGRQVAELTDELMDAGSHSVIWEGKDAPSGVYICRLDTGNEVDSRKLMVIR